MTEPTALVIGAGIAGASAAWHLTERGWTVIIADERRDGAATRAGAGIATPFTLRDKGDDWTRVMFEATQYYLDLVPRLLAESETSAAVGHYVVGELIVARDAAEAAELPAACDRISAAAARWGDRSIGVPRIVDAAEAARRHPVLAAMEAAIWLPDVAQVDGHPLRERLLAAAQRLGARRVDGHVELRSRAGGVRATIGGETVAADEIVVAAGAWTDRLLAPCGLSTGTYPQRGQLVHARLAGIGELPIITGFGNNYLLTFAGGRAVFGPTREDNSGFDQWPTIEGVHLMIGDALRLAPGLRSARWIETRSGLRPASRDGRPTIGRLADRLSVITGLGAQGLTLGGYVGKLIADEIEGRESGLPTSFSPARWADDADEGA